MTISSMTGYGKSSLERSPFCYNCEIKTLNSRFLEVHTRLPRWLSQHELAIQKVIKSKLHRGKVEVFFDIRTGTGFDSTVKLNEQALSDYLKLAKTVATAVHSEFDQAPPLPAVSTILNHPEILIDEKETSLSQDEHAKNLAQVTEDTIDKITSFRAREGAELENTLQTQISNVQSSASQLRDQSPEIQQQLQNSFEKRVQDILEQLNSQSSTQAKLDDQRLYTEVALFLNKQDIQEELDRLLCHCKAFSESMASSKNEPVGRKLDFLCQEMHREVNTISNKTSEISSLQITVNLKKEIEQIRQQVQNIE